MPLNRTPNELNREARKGINENWDKLEGVQSQIDNLVLESGGDSNLEVVQARGGRNVLNTRITEIEAKSNNPLGSMQTNGQKIPLSMLSNDVKEAMTGNTEITSAKGYFENNRGVEYPLKNMLFNGEIGGFANRTKNAILDVKVFGAKIDKVYRIMYVANGNESNGKERWGITLAEYDKDSLASSNLNYRFIFVYNNDTLTGNEGNANYQKGSDGIDTITVDNGEIACSVTVDRGYLSNNGWKSVTVSQDAPTAFIDPSNYFF